MNIEAMKALCEPSRCRIMMLLSERAYCVSALSALLGLSAPAISQHLKVLYDAGFVTSEKRGYHTHYKINKEQVLALAQDLAALAGEKPDSCSVKCSKDAGSLKPAGYLCSVSEIVDCQRLRKKTES